MDTWTNWEGVNWFGLQGIIEKEGGRTPGGFGLKDDRLINTQDDQ